MAAVEVGAITVVVVLGLGVMVGRAVVAEGGVVGRAEVMGTREEDGFKSAFAAVHIKVNKISAGKQQTQGNVKPKATHLILQL